MRVQVSYFSGTGCTEYVARAFTREFSARGHDTYCKNLSRDASLEPNLDVLAVCFVVHACNAPEPVMRWVRQLPLGTKGLRVAVISVSGGGEVSPNLACRVPIKKAFRKKKYHVAYEKMIAMPSNWIVETKPSLSAQLLKALPKKVSYAVNDILQGTERFTVPLLGNRIFTVLGSLEPMGARQFGKRIAVKENCTRCGLCALQCPVSNIEMRDKPRFGDHCVLCLNCIYACPQKALEPAIMKFVAIKTGFSFKEILARPVPDEGIDLAKEAKGFLWLGIKRYLLNGSDMMEPVGTEEI